MFSSSFNYKRHHPYNQVNTTEILNEVRDQEKLKKLSNKDQNEIYRLHVISLFQKKGEINMLGCKKNFKVLIQGKYGSVTPNEIHTFVNILSRYGEDTFGVFVASFLARKL
ncbi:20686_t:CDS:2 [Gigaspora rosea]|nr:20686_t:CDS:2 [Gigaspora rosea]